MKPRQNYPKPATVNDAIKKAVANSKLQKQADAYKTTEQEVLTKLQDASRDQIIVIGQILNSHPDISGLNPRDYETPADYKEALAREISNLFDSARGDNIKNATFAKTVAAQLCEEFEIKGKSVEPSKKDDSDPDKKSTNENTTTGSVAGGTPETAGIRVSKKKKEEEDEELTESSREVLGGCPVFEVSSKTYGKCMRGRKVGDKYRPMLDEDDDDDVAVERYARRNPRKPMIVKDKSTGAMAYFQQNSMNESANISPSMHGVLKDIAKKTTKAKDPIEYTKLDDPDLQLTLDRLSREKMITTNDGKVALTKKALKAMKALNLV